MKLWPVLTGIALSFTLIACKAPTHLKVCSRLQILTPTATSENGMK